MHIYIADENRIVAGALDDFLSSLGYSVISRETVGELVEKLDKGAPAEGVILADLQIKNHSHIDELRGVYERFPELNVIVMTANGSVKDVKM